MSLPRRYLSDGAESALAEAANLAYQMALRRGFRGSFLELELGFWYALRPIFESAVADAEGYEPFALDPHDRPADRLAIDPRRRRAHVGDREITLTRTEFDMLSFLSQNPGRSLSRRQIVDAIKGEDYPVTERSVDVQILGLRRKLGHLGRRIETVRGVGYRFQDLSESLPPIVHDSHCSCQLAGAGA